MTYRRNDAAKERTAERRRREDGAERLLAVVPALDSLYLEIDEARNGAQIAGSAHTRRFSLASAPSLFLFPCSDRSCEDGGHDLTRSLLGSLQAGLESFSEEHACRGSVANGLCERVLRVRGHAHYVSSPRH